MARIALGVVGAVIGYYIPAIGPALSADGQIGIGCFIEKPDQQCDADGAQSSEQLLHEATFGHDHT